MKNFNDIFNPEKQGPSPAPFDLPEGYFDTFEDRLEAKIAALDEKPNTKRTIIRILKPALGLAASFLLILLLVKYPISRYTSEKLAQQSKPEMEEDSFMKEILLSNSSFFDDKTLVQTMTAEPKQNGNSEELISIISEEVTDYEIFAELDN